MCVRSKCIGIQLLISAMPSSGSSYPYLRESFGRLPAFLFVWTYFLAIKSGSIAIISLIFAQYAVSCIVGVENEGIQLVDGKWVIQSDAEMDELASNHEILVCIVGKEPFL